jgi:type I restriction enzyme M protein
MVFFLASYDFITDENNYTLEQEQKKFNDLKDFIESYNPANRHKRKETFGDANPEDRSGKFPTMKLLQEIQHL